MQIDEFESRFKRADKPQFEYREIVYSRIFLVTDMEESEAESLKSVLDEELQGLEFDTTWKIVNKDDYDRAHTLLEMIDDFKPDLIVTYRNLRYRDKAQNYTLGIYVDVLTQATLVPVLILPYPDNKDFRASFDRLTQVMVITDHVQGDYQLIDKALPFVGHQGQLLLAHIEDKIVFDRYMEHIETIPAIPTDEAREEILNSLLKAPTDYIGSAKSIIAEKFPKIQLDSVVQLGLAHLVAKDIAESRDIGMIVANTKDRNQLAMHGEAYALAIELKTVPLLLL